MTMAKRTTVITVALLALIIVNAIAEPNVVAPVLQKGVGGRATGMADCYTGIAEGSFGQLYNPGGLAGNKGITLGFLHESTEYDTSHQSLGARVGLGPGSLGVVVNYFEYGTVESRDESGETTGEAFQIGESVVSFGYGMKFGEQIMVGANLNIYTVNLGVGKLTGGVVDLGGLYDLGNDFVLAAVVKNIGGNQEGYQVPIGMRIGGAYYTLSDKMIIDAEMDISFSDSPTDFGIGAEYQVWEWLDGRIGFKSSLEQNNNAMVLFVVGLGFNYANFGLDFNFVTRGDIGNEFSGALVYSFGGPRHKLRTKGKIKNKKISGDKITEQQIEKLKKIKQAAGKKKEAPEVKKTTVRIQGQNDAQAAYHLEAGKEYERYDQIIDAIIEYKAALKINPAYTKARTALAAAREKARAMEKKPEKIKSKAADNTGSLQKLIRKYYEKGHTAYNQKDYAEAIEQLQLVLELTSKHQQATVLLQKARTALKTEMSTLGKQAGRARENNNLPLEVDAYQKMLDLDPDNKAIKDKLSSAKKRIPKEVERLYKTGLDYYAKQQFRKALTAFEGVLKLQPNHVKAKDAVDSIKEKLIQTGQ